MFRVPLVKRYSSCLRKSQSAFWPNTRRYFIAVDGECSSHERKLTSACWSHRNMIYIERKLKKIKISLSFK